MAEPVFDELIHAPTRLSIVSFLAPAETADFGAVRDSLGLSDSALSKQISTLEHAGYVIVLKSGGGRRGRTRVLLSPAGRAAFAGHVAALQAMVNVPMQSEPSDAGAGHPDVAADR